MKIGSLFSGYGGLDMGVQAAMGGTVTWHVEFDANPSKILTHHWPDVPNYGDITTVDFTTVEPVDVITGGFPCQDVSHAGRRAGLIRDGEGRTRSGLWGHMLRAINEQRPALVVAENVRGLLSARADSDLEPCPFCMGDDGDSPMRALGAVLADLADIGYDAAWCGLRAADVGAPHGRFRVFILAWPADPPGDTRRVGHGDAVRTRWHQDRRVQDAGHRDALTLLPSPRTSDTNGPGHHGDGGMDLRTAVTLLPTPRAGDGEKGGPNQCGSSGDLMLPSAVQLMPTPSVADVEGGRKTRSGARNDELLLNGIAHEQRFGEYAPAIARWEHTLGRPAPAPTEPTGKAGAHRLSPAFVEWLMGLPEGHVTDVPDLSRNAQLKALGNGVVPQQAAAALTHLLTIRDHAQEAVA